MGVGLFIDQPDAYARGMTQHRFLIALGSNKRHARYGAPERVIDAALARIGLPVVARSRTLTSAPIGPSRRTYANAVVVIESGLDPAELLPQLKAIESSFGRRGGGLRWAARVLDLDIILWSGGMWATRGLSVPHAAFRERGFVLDPAAEIAGDWRDPVTGLRIRHLKARLDRRSRRA